MRKPLHPSQIVLAATLALFAGATYAAPGYLTTANNGAVTDSSGHCWHTGDWTPDKAAAPCDAVPRAAAPAAPLALREAPPPSNVIERVNLSSDVLFDFDKATLRPAGRAKLDEVAQKVKDARVDQVQIDGYADRIGSEQYNDKLSQKRAEAVRNYLAQAGIPAEKVQAEGHGKSDPVTGDQCDNMGPARKSNRKLVACLQPDRRVQIEVRGSRETAANAPGTPSSGTSSSSSGTSAPSTR